MGLEVGNENKQSLNSVEKQYAMSAHCPSGALQSGDPASLEL